MKFRILSIEDKCFSLLEGFKQYAGISDTSRDAMLHGLLMTAIKRVQEYADRALVETRVEIEEEVGEDRLMVLYLGGGEIVGLTDMSGSEVSYEALSGKVLKVAKSGVLTVVYDTDPVAEDLEECKPTIYRYASAMYDGATTDELNAILNEVI